MCHLSQSLLVYYNNIVHSIVATIMFMKMLAVIQAVFVSGEKHTQKIFYTQLGDQVDQKKYANFSLTIKLGSLQCKIFYNSILPSTELHFYFSASTQTKREREREREREAPTVCISGIHTYFLVIILRANQTLETIFRRIFQNTTKQLKIFSFSKNIFT